MNEQLTGVRRQDGVALLLVVLMLSLMGLIGLSSLDSAMRNRQVVGQQDRAQTSVYAADAGLADSLDIIRTEIVQQSLSPGDCMETSLDSLPLYDANDSDNDRTLSNGAVYRADPTAPDNKICMRASADPCDQLDASIEMGQAVFLYTLWDVRVEGEANGGSKARVQAVVERCHPFNN